MKNENDLEIKKPRRWKKWFVLFLLVIILGLSGYVYYWYDGIVKLQKEAKAQVEESSALIKQAGQYKHLKSMITSEYNRCQEFISQREGDFGSFEYCKRYIEWTAKNNLK